MSGFGNMAGGLGGRMQQFAQGLAARPQGMPVNARQAPVAPVQTGGAPTPAAPAQPTAKPAFTGAGTAYGGGKPAFTGAGTAYAKGGNVKAACYAEGGPVVGRTRSFIKGDDEFRTGKGVPQAYPKKGAKDSDSASSSDKSDKPARGSLRK